MKVELSSHTALLLWGASASADCRMRCRQRRRAEASGFTATGAALASVAVCCVRFTLAYCTFGTQYTRPGMVDGMTPGPYACTAVR